MTEHILSSSDPWFGHIQKGTKIYEGRRWSEFMKKIKVGDSIVFVSITSGEKCKKQVKKITICDTFQTALQIFPLEDILPGIKTIDAGVKLYSQYVSLKTQLLDGVCIIELDNYHKLLALGSITRNP
jgi:ASC-1-like (ASCH) protein